jgi:hypothetical protein
MLYFEEPSHSMCNQKKFKIQMNKPSIPCILGLIKSERILDDYFSDSLLILYPTLTCRSYLNNILSISYNIKSQ